MEPEPLLSKAELEVPHRIEVVIERINNLQSSVKELSNRISKWDEKNSELLDFKNQVLGGIQATSFTVRMLGWILGAIQVVVIAWVTAVNYGVHSAEDRLTKIETSTELESKSTLERNSTIDNRLNGMDKHNASTDSDIEQLKLGQDRLERHK